MTELVQKPDTLNNRLLVNVIGIPSLLGLIWLGGLPYFGLIAAITALGLREYISLLEKNDLATRKVPLFIAAGAWLLAVGQSVGLFEIMTLPSLGESGLIIVVILVLVIQTIEVLQSPPNAWLGFSAHISGFIWIAGFASTFILIRELSIPAISWQPGDIGFNLTLVLFVAVWACDSSAYLFGKRFGKTKLLPKVSPKKTVFGTTAGIVGALIVTQLARQFGWLEGFAWFDVAVLGVIAGVFGQLGDFVESRLKRDMGVKDTGSLLPGHGGVLDRFDSLLFVMPISYLYIVIFLL